MTLRFRRSVKVLPGVRLNFSSRGISTTIGPRGASLNFSSAGTHLNLGSTRTRLSSARRQSGLAPALVSPGFSPMPTPPETDPALPGEIRSADNDEITSVGLRGFRELLCEAHRERTQLRSELPTIQEQAKSALGKAQRWQNGFLLKHLLRKKYAEVLANNQEAQQELRELQKQVEQCRLSLEIEMDQGIETSYGAMVEAFRQLAACDRCWDTTSAVDIDRVRERSSAGTAITRSPVELACRGVDLIQSSRSVLHIPNANGGDLYIYPGMLLVFKGQEDFALIKLTGVRLEYSPVRFQERDLVPADSSVIGETWHKVNKDGSPDRRFANNFRIPVVQYGSLSFLSAAGLREEYMFSNAGKAARFREAFAKHQATLPVD